MKWTSERPPPLEPGIPRTYCRVLREDRDFAAVCAAFGVPVREMDMRMVEMRCGLLFHPIRDVLRGTSDNPGRAARSEGDRD